MKLIDLNEQAKAPFGPTPTFRRVYGHYCGPGNEGGEPIDDIDHACMVHDMCYHENGVGDCDCDDVFKKELQRLLDSHKLTAKQKIAAISMLIYFKRRKCHEPVPQG